MKYDFSIEEVSQVIKLNNHEQRISIDIFSVGGETVEDYAKGNDYEVIFIDHKLTNASTDYKGNENAKEAEKYEKGHLPLTLHHTL